MLLGGVFVDTVLKLVLMLRQMTKSSTQREPSVPKCIHLTILFILRLNNVTDKILPCGTSYCLKWSERVKLSLTLKLMSDLKLEIEFGKCPRSPVR